MDALPALVAALAVALYMYFAFQVGQARGKYGIKAPATTGNEMFERIFRIQMNTLEQLMAFLPALWLFVHYLEAPQWAAGMGTVWLIGRVIFARVYRQDPSKRTFGFVLTILPTSILLIGGMVGIVQALLTA